MYGTVRTTQYGYSIWEFQVYAGTSSATNTPAPATNTPTVQPPTNTPVGPTNTPAPTRTNTPVPPTNTPAAGCITTTNVALNKTATASSVTNTNTPNLAVDGNTGTRWESLYSDPQWLQVDLGTTVSVCQVTIIWETAYGKAYQIQTSPDATNWTTIYSTTNSPGGTENLSVSGSGRYIRM